MSFSVFISLVTHIEINIEMCLVISREGMHQCGMQKSLSYVIAVDEKLDSFQQYQRYCHYNSANVFIIADTNSWAHSHFISAILNEVGTF